MGKFDWFWKAMGSSSERNDKKSKGIVSQAHGLIANYEQRSDAELVDAIRGTVADGQIEKKPEFLAVLTVASARTLGMTPFEVQNQAGAAPA